MLVTFSHNVFYPFKSKWNNLNPLNPLPNNKIFDVTKLKAFADDKLKVDRMLTFLRDTVENTLGKEENAGYQHFLLFPMCFPKPTLMSLKVGIVW